MKKKKKKNSPSSKNKSESLTNFCTRVLPRVYGWIFESWLW